MKLKIFACVLCTVLLFGCGAKEETVQTTTSDTEQVTTTSVESTVASATDDATELTSTTGTTEQAENADVTTTVAETTATTRGTTVTTEQATTTTVTTTAINEVVTTAATRTKKTKYTLKTSRFAALTEISVTPSEVTLLVGETKTLTATMKPRNTTERVTWSSSNPAVATVAEDGTVTAVALGEAVITIAGEHGVSASCCVRVCEVALDLPILPTEVRYNADYSKKVAIFLQVTDVDVRYTANKELVLTFDGWLSYAADGKGFYTIPQFGWRVFDSEVVLAEGVSCGKEAVCVGLPIGEVTATIPNVSPGRYRLELYSTYSV